MQALLALRQLHQMIFGMLDVRAFDFGNFANVGGIAIELVPSRLPVVHAAFELCERNTGCTFSLQRGTQLRFVLSQKRFVIGDLLLIHIKVRLRLCELALSLCQVLLLLCAAVLDVLDVLLDARDVRTHAVVTSLHRVEHIGHFNLRVTLLFNLRFAAAQLGDGLFVIGGFFLNGALVLQMLAVQSLPTQRLQLRLDGALFLFQCLIAFSGIGLALQMAELFFQLQTQIVQAVQIFMRVLDAAFRFAPTLFVFRNSGGFFNEGTQVFRLGFNQARDHALLNDRVAARP